MTVFMWKPILSRLPQLVIRTDGQEKAADFSACVHVVKWIRSAFSSAIDLRANSQRLALEVSTRDESKKAPGQKKRERNASRQALILCHARYMGRHALLRFPVWAVVSKRTNGGPGPPAQVNWGWVVLLKHGKSPFYNIQMLRSFDFQPRYTKQRILQPQSIKIVCFSPFFGFQGGLRWRQSGFSFFSLSLQI